ncbi:LOW QUALITY PROTEIN: hypothetical protein CVT25_009615 [Psilocybe cyanescens]|uniref:Uncharacterized protein n=1 Tax=Psilocybe cyanescens TaxID=93625 RepID=A0A409XGU7_PSICY|nr:LOW QUALITY PROTEIN: hypothetical protein CVT25_009615 [Psilocybe cyanescens]
MKVDPGTYGAILLGALTASSLSGVFAVQCIVYFKCFSLDRKALKGFLSKDIPSRALEIIHTGLVWTAMWDSFIDNFGKVEYADVIPCFGWADVEVMTHTAIQSGYVSVATETIPGRARLRYHTDAFDDRYPHTLYLGDWFTNQLYERQAVLLRILSQLIQLIAVVLQQSHLFYAYVFCTAQDNDCLLKWVILDNSLIFLGLHFVVGKHFSSTSSKSHSPRTLSRLNARYDLRRAHSSALDIMHHNLPHITVTDTFPGYLISSCWKSHKSDLNAKLDKVPNSVSLK